MQWIEAFIITFKGSIAFALIQEPVQLDNRLIHVASKGNKVGFSNGEVFGVSRLRVVSRNLELMALPHPESYSTILPL